jgi:hypothetical protein
VNALSITTALHNLAAGAEFAVDGDTLDDITWLDGVISQPADQAITDEVAVVEAAWSAAAFQRNRQILYDARGADAAAMLEALWQKVMEADATEADALQVVRTQVQAEYPTPQE